uniref:Delta(3,5)-Delta(2,4)-dienoyl-CoA isomerase, mitochondrial n=2 Tax=Petromyzon marinus TaxID=7757 RepID=A0AAJ7TM67_PETMA|nr:delta(3,5)-Delta(2,4)-dienoyl-CoA isomerase, mitochondrial-like isoform X1 [Petromyzon marinus]
MVFFAKKRRLLPPICRMATVLMTRAHHQLTGLRGTITLLGRHLLSGRLAMSTGPTYETLLVTKPKDHVVQVEINRPEKRNALNQPFWKEMVECFNHIADDKECRAVVVSGSGKVFSAGIDLVDITGDLVTPEGDDAARVAWNLKQVIKLYQEAFNVIEKCSKPVIAAVHSACIGEGLDMISACDIRVCTKDAWFQAKEVDIGQAADVGTLQRLPHAIGSRSLVCEMVFTARKMFSDEAKSSGLVSHVYDNKANMMEGALQLAEDIASKSPVAVQGSKVNLLYARDHSVPESLEYMAAWNMAMLQTNDIMKSATAVFQKKNLKENIYTNL